MFSRSAQPPTCGLGLPPALPEVCAWLTVASALSLLSSLLALSFQLLETIKLLSLLKQLTAPMPCYRPVTSLLLQCKARRKKVYTRSPHIPATGTQPLLYFSARSQPDTSNICICCLYLLATYSSWIC